MAAKSKTGQFQGKLGYIFFTICIGLVCFYIGRVEFLAEKLQQAEKYSLMRPNQGGQGNMRAIGPAGRPMGNIGQRQNMPNIPQNGNFQQNRGPVLPPQQSYSNLPNSVNRPAPPQPSPNPDMSVNQREEAIDLWKQAEQLVESGKQVIVSDLNAAAEVMEKVENYAKKGVNAIESKATNVAANVVGLINENDAVTEVPLPPVLDIPSNDVAALISTINPIDLEKIYKSQVQECKAAQIKYKNEALKPSLFFEYNQDKWDWQSFNFNRQIPNPNFVFHNKLPKSGSSTMNNLMRGLAQKNSFNYAKVEPSQVPNDRFDIEKPLVQFVQETKKEPFFLLKHHFHFNFTRHGLRQPTYVNVVRDPTDWFVSQYYFRRYGWARDAKERGTFQGTEEDKQRTVDECIKAKSSECVSPSYKYVQYICGNHPSCRTNDVTEDMKEKATTMAKIQAMRTFFVIGILEQFEDTLKVFETILPSYYSGVLDIWQSDTLQSKRNSTKTRNRRDLSFEGRKFMMEGPLKWETDLYIFIRAMFNEKMRRLGIQQSPLNVT